MAKQLLLFILCLLTTNSPVGHPWYSLDLPYTNLHHYKGRMIALHKIGQSNPFKIVILNGLSGKNRLIHLIGNFIEIKNQL